MTDLFKLQTDISKLDGSLWPAVQDAISEARGELTSVTAERDALLALLADAKAKFLVGNNYEVAALIAESEKSAAQKAVDEAQADVDAANERLKAAQDAAA